MSPEKERKGPAGGSRKRSGRDWDPNRTTFEEGQPHLKAVMRRVGLDPDAQILTSRDPVAQEIHQQLQTQNVPAGFRKWQLPFSIYNPSNVYITVGEPNAKVPRHAHVHGEGYRVIIEGSILYEGKELTAGDWMYIPKGQPYSFEVGPRGVTLMAGYAC
jgi:quercetin dioxygenase-like cupin family protein